VLLAADAEDALAVDAHAARAVVERGHEQAHARAHQRRLPAAGFSGDAEHLAGGELKRHAVDGLHLRARAREVMDAQVGDVEDGRSAHRSLGLNTLSMAVFTM
jgi:hypothetical protein